MLAKQQTIQIIQYIEYRKKGFFASQWVPRSVYKYLIFHEKSFFKILNGHIDHCPGTIKINLGS